MAAAVGVHFLGTFAGALCLMTRRLVLQADATNEHTGDTLSWCGETRLQMHIFARRIADGCARDTKHPRDIQPDCRAIRHIGRLLAQGYFEHGWVLWPPSSARLQVTYVCQQPSAHLASKRPEYSSPTTCILPRHPCASRRATPNRSRPLVGGDLLKIMPEPPMANVITPGHYACTTPVPLGRKDLATRNAMVATALFL